jgi:hypothetical protein
MVNCDAKITGRRGCAYANKIFVMVKHPALFNQGFMLLVGEYSFRQTIFHEGVKHRSQSQ